MRRPTALGICVTTACLTSGCSAPGVAPDASSQSRDWNLVYALPKAPAFTQGLEFIDTEHGTVLGETSGLYGQSFVRTLDPSDPRAELARAELAPAVFAEGLTQTDDGQLLVGSWMEAEVSRFDPSLEQVSTTHETFDVWGMCADEGGNLIVSDGSSTLRRYDPDTFSQTGEVRVHLGGDDVSEINELECLPGTTDVLANVFGSDAIHRIDTATGQVTASWDLSELTGREQDDGADTAGNDVLNGIAVHPGDVEADGTLRAWVTGKNWRHVYVVDLKDPDQ